MKNYSRLFFEEGKCGLIVLCMFIPCLFLSSCDSSKKGVAVLQASNSYLTFSLNPQTSVFIKSLFPYTDENGKEFLTFQNNIGPQILVYDMDMQKYIRTISVEREGSNGVGLFCGYYIHSWNEIYLPYTMINEIDVIDSNGKVLRRISYAETPRKITALPFIALSFPYTPIYMLNQKMYIPQTPNFRFGNRTMEDSPVTLVLDTVKNRLEEFMLRFPPIIESKRFLGETLGIETDYSYVYDGTRFIYSFRFDENLFVVSPGGELTQKVKVKSKYIDKLYILDRVPNDFVKKLCEIPFYGNLIYDKYRDVYYRFVYPETELGPNDNAMDIWQLGRTKFSIMILNKDFEVIGETLFPENTYASNHFFIREDGLYLSTSFIKNPNFSDDELRFERIELIRGS